MPKSCSAYNCTNRYSKHTDITFHRFPFSKPTVFRQWLDNICRDDFYPKKHMVICSLHFTTDCFSGLGNRKNLLWNAVPTLFTFPPPNSKKRKSGKRLKMLPKCVTVSQEKMETQNDLDPEERLLSKSAEGNKKHVVIFDHSYSLSDPCAVKAQLFKALDTNKWLNRRLQMKSQLINKMRFKLKAARAELSGLRSWQNLARAAGKVSIRPSVQRIVVNDIS
ncbi:THAP domain-containing protein 3 isoform X2 [Salmo salar]|uniref:THAP domain-containing protein 3 isoform X2 n=1 Tax=Salmo salar TaxID=8030 RepID=A0A1S3LLS1_SALSA|nr:THAP domain-containing protein 3-like isoform X2 [Salmo salar]|eukprot:XP_013991831.1 PREDICTED: THAP domain-containing protein 3-like isoform X1 [Salmo salar]